MLRRRRSDPPFLRENLCRALRAGAACEVDIVFTADGHAFCLHDLKLDRETTGTGPAATRTRAEIESLRQRGNGGEPLDSRPLFLDEIVAIVRQDTDMQPGQVQLDVKAPLTALTDRGLTQLRNLLGETAPSFIVGGYDWTVIERLTTSVPGLRAGFDPLTFYPRSCSLDPSQFRRLGEKTLLVAPAAEMFYLEAKLVLAGLEQGVNLIDLVFARGAGVDVWTLDADRPDLQRDLRRLVQAGCHQITSNDPEALHPLLEEIAA